MSTSRKPVIIDKTVLESEAPVFRRFEDSINWITAQGGEAQIVEKVLESQSLVAVIGTDKYRNRLYEALSQNAKSDPSLLVRFGVGYDGVDLNKCRQFNVMLAITRDSLNRSVAEHVVALLLGLARYIPNCDRSVRNGEFDAPKGTELYGQSLGIVGFGVIGKTLSLIAAKGFGMKVFVYDKIPLDAQARKEGVSRDEFMALHGIQEYFTDYTAFAQRISIVSIHLSATSETANFFNQERLTLLRDGTILINTSRGSVIDEGALFSALKSGKLKAAGIDVFAREPYQPISDEYDLRRLPNVILTPHTASNTVEARQKMALRVVKNIQHFYRGEYEKLDRVLPEN